MTGDRAAVGWHGKSPRCGRTPLHGRAHAIAVAEIDIIAHAEFVAVIDHRSSRKRKEQTVEQLHLAPVVAQQRSQPPPDTQVDPRPRVSGINLIHVIAVSSVTISRVNSSWLRKNSATGRLREWPALIENVDNRKTVLHMTDMKRRGMTGKWKAIWHSSPEPK